MNGLLQSALFESPVQIAILGAGLTALLFGGWIQTGYRQVLYAALGVAALAVVLFCLERWVITDREAIRAMLAQAAADVERNDVEAVIGHFHSSRPDAIDRARREMPLFRFSYVAVKTIHSIDVYRDQQPLEAKTNFNVLVTAASALEGFEQTAPRNLELTLVQENGQWKIADYAHYDAFRGYQATPD